jgi:hypothetical protein
MTLNEFAAKIRLKLFEEIRTGMTPSVGEFDATVLREGRAKGSAQMGTTRYEPHAILVEFIFPDSTSSATVLVIRIEPPERIVFLPVPEWVIESIWQGDISGSAHFESDANRMVSEFQDLLKPGANDGLFGPQPAKRRE